jgi:hypothetical protein
MLAERLQFESLQHSLPTARQRVTPFVEHRVRGAALYS